jgi:prepilin peptidase CpaA
LPNWLTVGALGVAMAIRAASGPDNILPGLASAALAFAFGFPFFLAGGLGAGDVRLMAGMAAFLNPGSLLVAMGVMALTGALMAFLASARKGVLAATLTNVYVLVITFGRRTFTGWKPEGGAARITRATPGAVSSPYAVAIVAGVLAGWFLS